MQEITKASYEPYEEKMSKTINSLEENLHSVRAGRANPHVLDRILVDYYGTKTPINQVANVQIPEPRTITIIPWDPSVLKEIERAIQASDLGINPANDGKLIRLSFPTLTEDRRRELAKKVHTFAEEAKVAIRNIRREAIDAYRAKNKHKEITDDSLGEFEEEIQTITDRFIKKIDEMADAKEKDLLEI